MSNTAYQNFYPRPPRGGRPGSCRSCSTSPRNFYPRPPRGGRPYADPATGFTADISIHALREEGDATTSEYQPYIERFLSTPSARRATGTDFALLRQDRISIHALREEGDWSAERSRHRLWNFYPRPPRGGRLATSGIVPVIFGFLSTPSARRATGCNAGHNLSDVFLSTPSARRATTKQNTTINLYKISIHALREEGDLRLRQSSGVVVISIHALREEGDSSR